jgi:hypothetical protein
LAHSQLFASDRLCSMLAPTRVAFAQPDLRLVRMYRGLTDRRERKSIDSVTTVIPAP